MTHSSLGAARIFASHYQLVICDDLGRTVSDEDNWTNEKSSRGFAGSDVYRMVGTEADLNDYWVELVQSSVPPNPEEWQRITCVDFSTSTGEVHIMSVVDDEPSISAKVEPGEYAAYFAAQNLGVDQLSLGELNDDANAKLSDAELAARKDIEWYRIFLVAGRPTQRGRLVDRERPVDISQ